MTLTPIAEEELELGPGSTAVTDSEGRFTLETVEETRREGAVPGSHSVIFAVVTQQAEDDDSLQGAPEVVLAEQYRDGSLTFEVPPEGTDQANFEVETGS